ncbi:hypothetical protein ACNRWW_03500 [Metabacillus sp. HB246100]
MKIRLENLKGFLRDIRGDKAEIFNFEKVSSFERELFLSIQGVLNEKYDYHLDGLTNIHLRKFKEYLNKKNVQINGVTENLVEQAFDIYNMISKRNIYLGYGSTETKLTIKNEKYEKLTKAIENYINIYEKLQEKIEDI